MDAALFKDLADRFGAVLAARMRHGAGTGTTHGLTGKLTEAELERFAFPIQVVAQQLSGDIDDYLVLISDMELSVLEACLAGCGVCVEEDLGANVERSNPAAFSFDDMTATMDELAALYNERTLRFNTPQGDIVMILGDALLAAAHRANLPAPEQRIEITPAHDSAPPPDAEALPGASRAPALATHHPGDTFDDDSARLDQDSGSMQMPVRSEASTGGMAYERIDSAPPGSQAHVWSRLLTGVEVTVTAELGSTHMSLGDATGLATDSIVTLDQTAEDAMLISVNGTPFATARLVVVDEHYGIEILEIIDPDFAARAETWIAA